jgi:hypothetical protein
MNRTVEFGKHFQCHAVSSGGDAVDVLNIPSTLNTNKLGRSGEEEWITDQGLMPEWLGGQSGELRSQTQPAKANG